MTRRASLEQHRRSLGEIREIMNSMKTLAYMETRKLTRFLDAQRRVVQSIEDAAADLLAFHPEVMPRMQVTATVRLLVGSERGFCGDFNHALLAQLEADLETVPGTAVTLIAVGRKLGMLLEERGYAAIAIDGASVTEEVTPLLDQIASELLASGQGYGALEVTALYHDDAEKLVTRRLAPPFESLSTTPDGGGCAPILNESPQTLLLELANHYLFAALHAVLYTSLMAENNRRVSHLESAVKHLDDETVELARQCNALRQEEIIEEIEVILLSAAGLGPPTAAREDGEAPAP